MRKLIAAMKTSIDGRITGPDGVADWVEAWSDDYRLTPQVDACVLGAGMYPGYELYWTAIQNNPAGPNPVSGTTPTAAEVEWARFASRTPHYVLSSTMTSAEWPQTRFLRSADELAALKRQPGEDIYLVGGADTTAGLIDVGLVDELRLIVHPLIAGAGKSLFSGKENRRSLELRQCERREDGCLLLTYGTGPVSPQP